MNEGLLFSSTYNYNIGREESQAKFGRQDFRFGLQYSLGPGSPWHVGATYTYAFKTSDNSSSNYRRNTFGMTATFQF